MYDIYHSAKGTSWTKKDHKYIKKENGKYYYKATDASSKTTAQGGGSEIDYEKEFEELAKQIGEEQANQLLRYYKNINLKAVGSSGTKEDYDAALNKAYEDLFKVVGQAKTTEPVQESKSDTKDTASQPKKQTISQEEVKEQIKKKTEEVAKQAGSKAIKYAEEKGKKEFQDYAMQRAREVLAENKKQKDRENAAKAPVKKLATAAQTKAANTALTDYISKKGIVDDRSKLQKLIDKGTYKVKSTVKKIANETILDEALTLTALLVFKSFI